MPFLFFPTLKCIFVIFIVSKHGQDGSEVVNHSDLFCSEQFFFCSVSSIGKDSLSDKEQEDVTFVKVHSICHYT